MRKREGVEPRNNPFCTGSRASFPGNQNQCIRFGKNVSGVSGSKSVAGRRTVYIGTWENRSIPDENFRKAEEVILKYSVSVVGLTHSRGVNRVMPIEDFVVHSKGLAVICNKY